MQTENTEGAIHGVVTAATTDVAATNPNQQPAPKKRSRTDATAKAVKVGKTWTARLRRSGHDVYETGHKTRADAELAAARELAKRKAQSDPFGKGPKKTSFALALRDYATTKLPYMKGAKQEISRINVYLRLAKLPTINVIPVEGRHVCFKVEFEKWTSERAVPNGLHAHRKQLVVKTADSMRLRAVLATKMVADISRYDIQQLVNKMREEGSEAATIGLERSLLRAFFNYAHKKWTWDIPDNPATGLDMPAINNARERVLSEEEQVLRTASPRCRGYVSKLDGGLWLPPRDFHRMQTGWRLASWCWTRQRLKMTLPFTWHGASGCNCSTRPSRCQESGLSPPADWTSTITTA